MIRLRRTLLVALVGLGASAGPAFAQSSGTAGEFSYTPAAQQRGGSVQITGRCVNQGTTENVDMIVTVRQGADGQGDYGFTKGFIPADNGNVSGTIEVPGDAPFGEYVIGGACRNGPIVFFSKNGPFAVVEQGTTPPATTTTTAAGSSASTTTTTPGATTTTSTTLEGETTTTTEVTELETETTLEDDDTDATTTTVDEFAATRNDDDDSIAPLIILFGVVPLVVAIAAVVMAMRRRATPPAA